jgi:hypothetical protein
LIEVDGHFSHVSFQCCCCTSDRLFLYQPQHSIFLTLTMLLRKMVGSFVGVLDNDKTQATHSRAPQLHRPLLLLRLTITPLSRELTPPSPRRSCARSLLPPAPCPPTCFSVTQTPSSRLVTFQLHLLLYRSLSSILLHNSKPAVTQVLQALMQEQPDMVRNSLPPAPAFFCNILRRWLPPHASRHDNVFS